jgi:hypothetical protein
MVQQRAKAAGIATKIGCHTFRATGITIYLTNAWRPRMSGSSQTLPKILR